MPDEIDDKKSILRSVKRALDVSPDDPSFDGTLIMHINTVISQLNQLGLDPTGAFEIEDESTTWTDFIGDNKLLNMVKSYVVLQTRLLFDPPTTSFQLDSIRKVITELEWRINVHTEKRSDVAI